VTDDAPLFRDDTPWEEAQGALADAALSDGLPMVPPTERRLAAMLAGVADPDASLGPIPPLFGELTARAVAYQCVLAGCVPAELPVVFTAAGAALEAEFNLLGIQTTTGTPTVAVVVHGPDAVGRLGMNAGTNCLGPGNRANACIGRAVRLVMQNVGGARPGIGDMATMGTPGKYGLCFAEHVAGPLLRPLHARRGLAPEETAVTVLGVSGTVEVLPVGGETSAEAVLRPMLSALKGGGVAAGGGRVRDGQEQALLLPPEMAGLIEAAGWTLGDVQRFLFEEGGGTALARSPADIHPILTGGPGVKMTALILWHGGTLSVTRPLARL
jgi:hypothetical protein